ncbi:MAG: DNA repair protein RadA [Acutalibacteraceae bacterium]|nr:DNA repair protein RadA [Acutalibacteraceae bacterium]
MAPKTKTLYVCNQCGYESAKWFGCCPGCSEWNTMEEDFRTPQQQKSIKHTSKSLFAQTINEISADDEIRFKTGMDELDRVLGGGIVKGSLVLLSGDPGIGKSTILLQICEFIGRNLKILYVSGEESARQIKLRANRLGVSTDNLLIMCQTDVESITEYIKSEKPDLVIVDSIQTMCVSEINSSPGSVTQVRESTNLYMHCAKGLGIPTILVGHVNKDGNIAGPKVLEHVVDCVLYFEGERHLSYRILRAVKNRFGSTNEIGVFEMLDKGLVEVQNPSLMLISGKPKNTAGTCIACVMEGSRPILAEVQGLVASSSYGNPRRMSTGFDYNRMSMLLAVLEKRAGFFFSTCDAYINVVGGLRLDEPATDLSVALALISSLKDTPIRDDTLVIGEIGLGGELRTVSYCEQRIKEAERLGFKRCIIPKHNLKTLSDGFKGNIEIVGARNVNEAFNAAI